MISLPIQQLEDLLESAAERGAKKALAAVGLEDDMAPSDVRGLRDLFGMYRVVRKAALQQIGKTIVLVVLSAIAVYVGVKLKLMSFT